MSSWLFLEHLCKQTRGKDRPMHDDNHMVLRDQLLVRYNKDKNRFSLVRCMIGRSATTVHILST